MTTADRRPLVLREFRWLRRLAAALAQRGVSANAISLWGLGCAAAAGGAWACTSDSGSFDRALWLAGAALAVLRIFANTLDGLVAVEYAKAAPDGLLYNEAPDRIADSFLLIGAGYAYGGAATLGTLAAAVALFVSYVRLLGQVAGAGSDYRGPMDKGGRMIVLIATAFYCALIPDSWQPAWGPAKDWGAPALALALISLGGIYTAARRLRSASRRLRDRPRA